MTLKPLNNHNIIKSNNDSNIYIIKDLKIAIDAGNSKYLKEYKQDLQNQYDLTQIKSVILTHLHHDHIGCTQLFPNAKFYASGEIIEDFKNRKNDYILDLPLSEKFNLKLHDINELTLPLEYEIMYTPGHCSSCICLYDSKNKILFSGDTLFFNGLVGRADLPTSDREQLLQSLHQLNHIKINLLCPGHDY